MPMTYISEAIKSTLPSMEVPDTKAYLDDLLISEDSDKTIVSGFFRLEKSKPLVYEYTYHEMKIIVEGEMIITDETGSVAHAKPGDIFYFRKGSIITFDTPSYGIGFFCGQRAEGEA
ncbi:MAG: cupin domain-containing protein [Thiotrichales bacterium]